MIGTSNFFIVYDNKYKGTLLIAENKALKIFNILCLHLIEFNLMKNG
jgi:hypothetical protein